MLNEKIKLLSERCDDLQAQISAMKEERAEEQDAHLDRAKQTLLERENFNFKDLVMSTSYIFKNFCAWIFL